MVWWNSLGFQDGVSPLMEQLIMFHDHTMVILVFIIGGVGSVMSGLIFKSYVNRGLSENQTVEVIWTLVPAIVLLFIAFPSLRLLYLLDEVGAPSLSIKIVGHQWFWSYEYSDYLSLNFDSYLVPESELEDSAFRVLEVDNRLVVPYKTPIRFLVTAADVIHSWTVPSLGIKVDAVPGRLNQLSAVSLRAGVLYGQCSEICGANHSFMPIVVESVSGSLFLKWLSSNL